MLPLWWSDYVDLHVVRGEGCHFFLHAVSEARKHGGTTGQNNVGVEVLSDVNITLSDGVIEHITDAGTRKTHILGAKENLGAQEPLLADGDHFAVRKLVGLLQRCGGGSGLHLLLKVKSDIAELLLDVTVYLPLSWEAAEASPLPLTLQVPQEVSGDVTATNVDPEDRFGKSMTIADGDGMGDTITSVQHCSSGASRGEEGQDSLEGDVHGRCVEGLEHDLGHLLPVGLGVKGGLGQENWMFLRGNAELFVEGVVPDLLHIFPVGHDPMLNGISQSEDTSIGLGLRPHVVLLALVLRVAGMSHDRREGDPARNNVIHERT